MFFWDPTYIVILPAIIFALYAQMKVQSTFAQYQKIYNKRGYTGASIARKILDENGLHSVRIERINGHLTDHFDPSSNVVRLSDSVYDSQSVASIGVAAHEVGHAIQHATSYGPIKIRSAIIPMTKIGSTLAFPLVLIGIIMSTQWLISFGIFLFTAVVLFQAVTLPVEFNASSRALKTLENYNILNDEELRGSKKVLSAAAMTYVAALVSSLLSLFRLLLIANRNRRD